MHTHRLYSLGWLALSLFFLSVTSQAQNLRFGESFDSTGVLVRQGTAFKLSKDQLLLGVKYSIKGPLPFDTLYVLVKDLAGTGGRYYMKRSKTEPTEANSILRFKQHGIYRVYVYTPRARKKPIAQGHVYVTSDAAPDRAALLELQRQELVKRGVIQDVRPKPGTPPLVVDAGKPSTNGNLNDDVDEVGDLEGDLEDDDAADGAQDIDNMPLDNDLDADEQEALADAESDENLEDIGDDSDLEGEFESFDDLEDELGVDIDDI